MGYIYKITNTVNDKVYIGQTVKTVEQRFKQHKNNSNKDYFSQIILYRAFNKYGIENFICEEIEEVSNDKLDEREKYWIKHYDSYFDGYNSTLGGREIKLYNFDIDDIIEKYQITKSARKVAQVIGCDHSTIDNILNQAGVYRFTTAEQTARPIVLEKNEKIFTFQSSTKAAQWLIDTKQVKSQSIKCVRGYLTNNYLKNKPYYGYNISYKE